MEVPSDDTLDQMIERRLRMELRMAFKSAMALSLLLWASEVTVKSPSVKCQMACCSILSAGKAKVSENCVYEGK
jgi:hypothetical protein